MSEKLQELTNVYVKAVDTSVSSWLKIIEFYKILAIKSPDKRKLVRSQFKKAMKSIETEKRQIAT